MKTMQETFMNCWDREVKIETKCSTDILIVLIGEKNLTCKNTLY